MHTRKLRTSPSGQGLVEYALVLAIVSLVAIAVIGLISLAVQGKYGILSAVLGSKKESPGVMVFSYKPRCGSIPGNVALGILPQATGLYAELDTGIPDMSELTVSTDTGIALALIPKSGGYIVQSHIGDPADLASHPELCPRGLVVQSSQAYGAQTVLYPVEIRDWTVAEMGW